VYCDISHAFKTAEITVFYPVMYKTPEVPLEDASSVIWK